MPFIPDEPQITKGFIPDKPTPSFIPDEAEPITYKPTTELTPEQRMGILQKPVTEPAIKPPTTIGATGTWGTEPFGKRLLKDYGRGVVSTVTGLGGALKWIGAEKIGKPIAEHSKKVEKSLEVEDPKFVDHVASGLGSLSTFFIPGFGIAKGVGALSIVPRLAMWFGIGTSSVMEAVVEAGGNYEQSISKGQSVKEAQKVANKTFWGNLPVLLITNRLGLFSKGKAVGKSIVSSLMEGTQEATQEVIGNIALNDPVWQGVPTALGVGAITGGGMSLITSGLESIGERKALKIEQQKLKEIKAKEVEKPAEIIPETLPAEVKPSIARPEVTPAPIVPAVKSIIPEFKSTEEAISFGKSVKDKPEIIQALKTERENILKQYDATKSVEGKEQELMNIAVKGQFVREAIETAEEKLPELAKGVKPEVKLDRYKTDINIIADELKSGQAGYRLAERDERGNLTIWKAIPSTYPEYFKNKGLAKKDILHIVDKYQSGKELTEKQKDTLFDLVKDRRIQTTEEIRKMRKVRKPTEVISTGDLDLNIGDRVKVGGEWLDVTKKTNEELILKDGQKIVIDPYFDKIAVEGGEKFGIKRKEPVTEKVILGGKQIEQGLIPGIPRRELPPTAITPKVEQVEPGRLLEEFIPEKEQLEIKPTSNIIKVGEVKKAEFPVDKNIYEFLVIKKQQEGWLGTKPNIVEKPYFYGAETIKETEIKRNKYLKLLEPEPLKPAEIKPEIQGYRPIEIPAPQKIPIVETPEIIKKSDIMNFLSEKLDVPIRRGHFRQKAWGIYKRKPDIIRIKQGGLETVSHEIGHFLDDTIPEIKALRKHNRELVNLTRSFPKHLQTSSEGIAEFIRLYITNRNEAKIKAPKYFNEFDKIMSEKYSESKDILDVAEKQYKQWLSMPSVAKVKSQISFDPEKPKKFTYSDFYTATFDNLNPLNNYTKLAKQQGIQLPVEDNPYILGRLFRGWVGRANHFLEYGTFNKKLQITGKGLKQILNPISKKNIIDDFSVYLVSKRAVELNQRGIQSGILTQDATESINQLKNKYPEFENIAQELYNYQDKVLLFGKESGLFDNELYNKIKELNKNYVPFYRIVEQLQRKGYLGKTFANISNPIKRIKGSEREIVDPIESIMKNTYTIINSADRNQVGVALVRLSLLDKELGRMVEELPPEMSKVANVRLSEILSKEELENLNIPEEEFEKVTNIFRPSMFNPKDNILTVLIDGKKRFFQVDPDLYKSMLNLDVEDLGLLTKILSYPARALRAGATLSPEFLGRNPFRDQLTAFIFSEYGYKPFIDIWGGLASVVGKTDDFQLWLRSGGAHSMLVSMDRDYIRRNLKELFKGKSLWNPLEALRALSQLGEEGTRLGEFKLGIKKGISPLESAFASREVTLDFSRLGTKIKIINSVVSFFNANVQGIDKVVRVFKEHPKRTMLKILAGITLPSILLYMLNRKSERYKELPAWERDYYWIIDINDKVPLIKIPKPFELGVFFGSGVERFLQWLDKKDPQAFDKYAKNLISSVTPPILPTAATPILEDITNYSFFRNRPLESQQQQKLLPEERYYQYTPSLMRWMGKYSGQVGLSSIKLENIIRGYFGGLGGLIIGSPDLAMKVAGRSNMPLQIFDIPLIKGFIARDPYGFTSETVARFYNKFEKVTQYYTTIKELSKDKKFDEANKLKEKYPDYKYYNTFLEINKALGELRRKQETIFNSKISPEEKNRQINQENKKVDNIVNKFSNRIKYLRQ